MTGYFFRALGAGLLRGPLVAALVVPLIIVATVVSGAVGLVFALLSVLGTAGMILAGIIAAILSVAVTVLITVQAARYAGTLTGLRPLIKQPPFMSAYWTSFVGILVITVISAVVLMAVILAFGGVAGLLSLGVGALITGSPGASGTSDGTGDGASLLNAGIGLSAGLALGLFASGYYAVLAAWVVPRACLEEAAPARAYSPGLVALRVLIVVPFYGLVTVLVFALAAVLLLRVSSLLDGTLWRLLAGFVSLVAAQMLLGCLATFEARLLSLLGANQPARTTRSAPDPGQAADYRALREEWSRR
ncbi:MAG: hypothetical protein AAGK00_19210 [Pseudomonadota bacterium]